MNTSSEDSTQSLKSNIRREMRQKRRVLESRQHYFSEQLKQQLFAWSKFAEAKHVAGYLAQDGELSLEPTLISSQNHGKLTFLPILRPLPPNRLWFAPFTTTTQLKKNRFGILEPVTTPNQHFRISRLDIVLFPLVAFDSHGGRLGMGGGFYDRTFEHLITHKTRPSFVGIAYEQQRVERLPIEPWDIPLDAVATPEKVWVFS
ncbi:5-formyltetrahydrofolate cyclo-ligase [Pleionea sediminis]|uniref:5-formyltetrahydrofolate cyclo-ligase n=1 Tax=Pleionea sediminis TaxID=2569479 RepID=UPI0011856F80|nr:5-formyltetrahydrofolate cyclo-ligase [Pleionea sediminis]